MIGIAPQEWKTDLPEFCEKTRDFYAGKMDKGSYKGFSGRYGSYAQKGGAASMLRLRMTAGCVSKEKLAFIAKAIRAYQVNMVHFTTCESVQFHNLDEKSVCELMEQALDAGIVTMGGGGDFPRNVMCSPLSGVEEGEYFDVMPWAKAAGEYLMTFINAEKMPRKLKVCFSNSPANVTHATYRDLGFVACPDGTFDVYSAGGLGNNPQFGVKVAEGVAPEKILYYIKAMWLTFRAYGNYENRGKARTRYMQEALGGAENYRKAYQEKLQEVLASGEQLDLSREEVMAAAGIKEKQSKTGDDIAKGKRAPLATGAKYVSSSGIYNVDDGNGPEIIARRGRYTRLEVGDGVVPADLTARLFALAKSPEEYIMPKVSGLFATLAANLIGRPGQVQQSAQQPIYIAKVEVTGVEDVDGFLDELTKIVNRKRKV